MLSTTTEEADYSLKSVDFCSRQIRLASQYECDFLTYVGLNPARRQMATTSSVETDDGLAPNASTAIKRKSKRVVAIKPSLQIQIEESIEGHRCMKLSRFFEQFGGFAKVYRLA